LEVLLLGNGFDIYHNLLTRYDNFMKIGRYIRNQSGCLYLKTRNVYNEIKALCEVDNSIYNSLSMYKNAYLKTIIDPDEYFEFVSLIRCNCWFDYFDRVSTKDGWVALEMQIDSFLHEIKDNDISNAEPFLEFIKYHFNSNDMFNINITLYDVPKEEYDELIFNEFESFIKLLKLYLKIFVNDVLSNIVHLYSFENEFINYSDYIITFNYTDTYKYLYNSNVDTIYIHGSVDNDIILGVNSNESDDLGNYDLRFIKYKKYYQRITKHTFNGLEKLVYDMKSMKTAKLLKVIGHSLDLADEDILTVIFDWFDSIIIYYHNDEALDLYVKNLKKMYGAKMLSKLTFSQTFVFERLPVNNYKKVIAHDQL